MRNPLELLLHVNDEGGQLDIAGERIRILYPFKVPAELKEEIVRAKPELMKLMSGSFCWIRVDGMKQPVFHTVDSETRRMLVRYGAVMFREESI